MLLLTIGVLVGVAICLLKSIVAPGAPTPRDGAAMLPPWHSDYKQLRVEYHQSVDRSLAPPGQ